MMMIRSFAVNRLRMMALEVSRMSLLIEAWQVLTMMTELWIGDAAYADVLLQH